MSAITGEDAATPPEGARPRPPRSPQPWSRSERRWARIRWALLVCWLIVVVVTGVTGERAASWDKVRTLVAAGDVDTVRVAGELPARVTGYSVVEVHWRHGLMRYTADVVQVRGRSAKAARAATEGATPVVHTAPSDRLRALQPNLRVTQNQQRSDGNRLLGWQVTSSLGLIAALLFFAGLGVLIAGPQPWRATRWAWFWLLLPPVGAIAFLLASGPTPGIPGPRDPHRRLTGGWAFLLSFPLLAVLAPYRW